MNLFFKTPARLLVTTLAVAGLMFPVMASAQPSYAQPAYASGDESIHGRIASIDGTFNLSLQDDRGFVDNIELHQGTIINPTGLTLAPGMSVTITGYAQGSYFEANEIDTPYQYSGPAPVPVYYGAGWWYPGYGYGYGPSFLLAINFFGGGYRFEHRRFEGREWDGRGFFSGRVYVQGSRVISDPRYAFRGASGARDTRSYNAPRNDSRTYTAPQRTDTRSYNAPRTDTRTYNAPRSVDNGNAGTAYTRTQPSYGRSVTTTETTVRAYPSSSARTYQTPARTYQAPTRTYQAPARTTQAPARTTQTPARDTSSRGSSNSSSSSSSKGDKHRN